MRTGRAIRRLCKTDWRRIWTLTAGHSGKKHAKRFARGFYRQGVLGRFIGAVHLIGRLARVDFRPLLQARNLAEQEAFFTRRIAPLFDMRMVRFLARQRTALFWSGYSARAA